MLLRRVFVILLALAVLMLSSRTAPAAEQSSVIGSVPTAGKYIALTFDAGAGDGRTTDILNLLADRKLKCTFFLTGNWVDHFPDLAAEILKQGHEIGNHSYGHPDYTKLSAAKIKEDLAKADSSIVEATGKAPKPLFRPPYGSYNAGVLKAVGEAGYPWTIMWSTDTVDWKGVSAETIIKRVDDGAKPGAIVLMHVGYGTHTHEALPRIINNLQAEGYELVTV